VNVSFRSIFNQVFPGAQITVLGGGSGSRVSIPTQYAGQISSPQAYLGSPYLHRVIPMSDGTADKNLPFMYSQGGLNAGGSGVGKVGGSTAKPAVQSQGVTPTPATDANATNLSGLVVLAAIVGVALQLVALRKRRAG